MNRERLARWREDNLLRRVLRNSSYLSSSNAVSGALGLLQGILATRLIGVDGYGLVTATIVTFASNVNNLLSFRMSDEETAALDRWRSTERGQAFPIRGNTVVH